MTKEQFDLIIDTVGTKTKVPCPESFRIILWGKYKDWDSVAFANLILSDITLKVKRDKHINS